MRKLIDWLLQRENTHRNPYSSHVRRMMAMERQEKEAPWMGSSFRQWHNKGR